MWSQLIEFSFSTFSCFLIIISVLRSPSCFFVEHVSTSVLVSPSLYVHSLPSSMFYLPYIHRICISQPSHACFCDVLTYMCTPFFALIPSVLNFSIICIPISHLGIIISVISSKSFSSFIGAHVSPSYIRTDPMTIQ